MNRAPAPDTRSEAPEGVKFHENIASDWHTGYLRRTFRWRLTSFCKIIDRTVEPGEIWLDLGCGSGVITRELLRRGAIVTAVDGAPSMLRSAKNLFDNEESNAVKWICGDGQNMEWQSDSSCDGILCSSVIEYADHPQLMLSEINRVIKKDGKLIISVPPKLSLVRSLQKIARFFFRLFGRDVHSYLSVSKFEVNARLVSNWLEGSGFKVVKITTFDPILREQTLPFWRPSLLIIEARKINA